MVQEEKKAGDVDSQCIDDGDEQQKLDPKEMLKLRQNLNAARRRDQWINH